VILDTIVAHKRQELQLRQASHPLAAVRSQAEKAPPARNFARAIRRHAVEEPVRLIAEVKRASPSRGVFRPNLDPIALADTYVANGASAISVLTDERFFQGSLEDLKAIRGWMAGRPLTADRRPPTSQMTAVRRRPRRPELVEGSAVASEASSAVPLLRKDFLFDPYQVYEARAAGADAVLLIVAILEDDQLADLLALTRELGMTALVEVHDREELDRALAFEPEVIGVNNRDLRDFSVDLATTEHLRPHIPDATILVAESGIHTAADVQRLACIGVDAVLVGEALVTAADTAAKVRELSGR
jgi:indole-3-glycerol phosphate synthase